MTELTANRKVVKKKISSLKPHPKQAEMFGDLPPAELKLLADDIGTNAFANRLRQRVTIPSSVATSVSEPHSYLAGRPSNAGCEVT